MPVLSFPCTIHCLGTGSRPARRRVWIKGHDLRSLALVATKQLGVTHHQCDYALTVPGVGSARRALLEITHPDGDALVGPIAAPMPTAAMEGKMFTLDALLGELGFSGLGSDYPPSDSDGPRRHLAMVTYSPLHERHPFPPVRQPRETDTQYRQRYDDAERIRIERASQQGVHLVRYDVPPEDWTAQDIEALMVVAYQLLPESEPRWRESGAITQAKFVNHESGRVTLAYSLQIGRGDYIAHLRLPAFPTLALAEWLASRHCDINLRQPVMRLELIARGWRHIERIDRGETRRRAEEQSLAGWCTTQ
jgi:hypothetical protein